MLLNQKQEVIQKLLLGKLDKNEAAILLKVKRRSINRYIKQVTISGLTVLVDRRGGNNHKLSPKQEKELVSYSAIASPHKILKEIKNKEGIIYADLSYSDLTKFKRLYPGK